MTVAEPSRAGLVTPGFLGGGLAAAVAAGAVPSGADFEWAGYADDDTDGSGLAAEAGVHGRPGLSERLTAVARLIQIGSARSGPEGFSPQLLGQAENLLARAGERLRMSAGHTVVVLAGGTGSGKSSLFNVLAGADLSPAGVVRPMTRAAHACVWGMEGAGPLLDWLGVARRNRYARSSALDDGERSLAGLVLLDLPDHDSVLAAPSGEVNRLVGLADLMVWVLDPQKYADAAVHSRYLVPMAGHAAVIAVVLNQADVLAPEQVDDCLADLQRLLDGEGLHEARVLVTSAATGAGTDDLRKLLTETVLARQAASERIGADVDALAERFAAHSDGIARAGRARLHVGGGEKAVPAAVGAAADSGGGTADGSVAGGGSQDPVTLAEEELTGAFAQAAGVSGVGRALQSARELRAADYIGWPISWLADRVLRRDPVRRMRLGTLWDELRGVSAGQAGAHAAEVDNAISVLADGEGRGLPPPWSATVRQAARSRATDIPAGLGSAVAEALPAQNRVSLWWRLVAAWQGLLLGGAVVGLAWAGVLIAIGVFHASSTTAPLFSDVGLLPWAGLMVAGLLALGWFTAVACMTLVVRAASQERERAEERMRAGIAGIARQLVMMPVEQELSEYARFCDELAVARGLR